ncbi:MAG: hypothetical protein ACT4P3_05310 [Betaproteobacteria bacterium]
MLSEFLDLQRWAQWFSGLEREFIFLLALPFVVAIIGLWSALADKEQVEEEREPANEPREVREERRRLVRRRSDAGRVSHHGLG